MNGGFYASFLEGIVEGRYKKDMVTTNLENSEIRWLHFSDIHFNFDGYDTEKMRDDLKQYIKKLHLQPQDMLFITGDFRFAPKEEYLPGTKEYVNELVELLLNDKRNFFFVAGNHDLCRADARVGSIKEVRAKYTSSKGDIEEGNLKLLKSSFADFEAFAKDWDSELFPKNNPHRLFITNKANIVCLNTAVMSGVDSADEYGQLIIGIKKLKECLKKSEKGKPIIVCGHHSLESLTYDERIRVVELFQKHDIHIYLCGHDHRFLVNNVNDDEDYKLYEIFAGNLYTEERYSQCGFIEGHLQQGKHLTLRCHEWDFNTRRWHLSNTYSKTGDGTEKCLDIKPETATTQCIARELSENTAREDAAISSTKELSDQEEEGDLVNILHLSDLQFGITAESSLKKQIAIDHRKMILEKMLIDYLKTSLPEQWKPQIIVVSGDLAWNAVEEDYMAFSAWLKKLLAALNLSSERVVLCTGNHDISSYAASKNSGYESISPAQAHRELYDELETAKLYDNFKEFIDFCKGKIDPEMSIVPLQNVLSEKSDVKYLYGFRDLLGIRFNVLNTSWYCGAHRKDKDSRSDKQNLWIGKGFVQDLQHNLLNNDKFSVTIFHHPFDWLNPEEGDDNSNVKKCLLKLSDIIICGHVHTKVGEPTFEHNRAQIFQSGSLWNEEDYVHEARIIRINKKTGKINQLTLEYDSDSFGWKHMERVGPNKDKSYPINYSERHDLS